jgi:hypothetical protein
MEVEHACRNALGDSALYRIDASRLIRHPNFVIRHSDFAIDSRSSPEHDIH